MMFFRNAVHKFRRLTFDMSGGARGAKRPLGRPLDGGVRRGGTATAFFNAYGTSGSLQQKTNLNKTKPPKTVPIGNANNEKKPA